MLKILFQNEDFVAIDKPSGLLVHRTSLARDRETCLSILRDQLGKRVFPVHRLDRPTSGVLLFGLSSEAASRVASLYRERGMRKTYAALVRGTAPESGRVEKMVRDEDGIRRRQAISEYTRLASVELPLAVIPRYPTSRYSLLEVRIETGRRHQIRQHLASVSHPIVGDTMYGQGTHNRFFRDRYGVHRLMLVARQLEFVDPLRGERVRVTAPWPDEFERLGREWGWALESVTVT